MKLTRDFTPNDMLVGVTRTLFVCESASHTTAETSYVEPALETTTASEVQNQPIEREAHAETSGTQRSFRLSLEKPTPL